MVSRPFTSLSYAARRELIRQAAPFYQEASLAQKGLLLDRTVAVTGYARKYAIRLLNQTPSSREALQPPSPLRTVQASFPAYRSSLSNAP